MTDTRTIELVAYLRQLALDIGNDKPIGNVAVLDAASAIERLDADAACEKAEKESLKLEVASLADERADYQAAYNRVATAGRAITAELQKIGDETQWRDGDETDRVYAWYEMLPLVRALDADIHRSAKESESVT